MISASAIEEVVAALHVVDVPGASAVIRSIELHSPPGKTTVAIDAELAQSFRDGTMLTRA